MMDSVLIPVSQKFDVHQKNPYVWFILQGLLKRPALILYQWYFECIFDKIRLKPDAALQPLSPFTDSLFKWSNSFYFFIAPHGQNGK